MKYKLHSTLSRNKSKVLAEELIRGITQNKPAPHTRYFSDKDLCIKTGYNLQTVRRALSRLVELGYVYRVQGKGTLISPRRRTLSLIIVFTENSSLELDYQFLFFQACLVRSAGELSMALQLTLLNGTEFTAQSKDLRYYYPALDAVIFYKNIDPLSCSFSCLTQMNIPHMFFGSDCRLSRTSCAGYNYYVYSEKSIADAALTHLRAQGRRRIALVCSSSYLAQVS